MKKLNTMIEDGLLTPLSDPVPRGRQRQFPISVIVACCAALFLRPAASLAIGDSMSRSGPTVASIVFTATPVNHGGVSASGAFTQIYAASEVNTTIDDNDAVPPAAPYVAAGSYATTQTSVTGVKFIPESKVAANITIMNAGPPVKLGWNTVAAAYGIDVTGPTGGTRETAYAHWHVLDPLSVSGLAAGDTIGVAFSPASGMGMIFPDANPNASYSSTFSASAQTDVPGLSSLFSLSIQMSSATPGNVGVSFTSNPLLGLNDAAITSELVSGFQYDSTTGDYSFDPTGQEIDATMTVPAGVSVVNVTSGMGDELDASVVPEPSTVALLGIGAVSLLAREWRRRTAKS